MILDRSTLISDDVVSVAQFLLGKWLMTSIDGAVTGGMIIETEAYKGPEDRACHAYGNRRTKRTEVMFHKGGIAYIYFCYGMHHLFNVVTGQPGNPHAVLIRALKPTDGIDQMEKRRNGKRPLTAGPGMVCQALGIEKSLTGHPLQEGPIWIEDRGFNVFKQQVQSTKRVGIDYAGEDALLPWRFLLANDV